MKNTVFTALIMVSVVGMVIAHFYYQNRVNTIAKEAISQASVDTHSQEKTRTKAEHDSEAIEIGGWLGDFLDSQDDDSAHIVFFGSSSIENENGKSWPELVMEQIENGAASPTIDYEVISVGSDTTSDQLLEEGFADKIAESEPAVVVLESLTLNDNGHLAASDSIAHLSAFIDAVSEQIPGVEIILVPTNPIGPATVYPGQIDVLNEQAPSLPVTYFDHWDAWPAEEEMAAYVESGRPTSNGHELWASVFSQFFIGE
ncbi:hypothetical protein J26TS2_19130 [Shouchella clausii]|nr:hypothetical protein J26TS2_19130 [Shouchella clausii]